MERETRLYMFVFALLIALIVVIIWYTRAARRERVTIAGVRQMYDQAIQEGNKRLALKLGREYYSMLRGGRLTSFDEQAIANDLSTIEDRSAERKTID